MTYPDTRLFIAGAWQDAADGRTLAVINPSTGLEIGRVAHAGIADLDRALAAAQSGFENLGQPLLCGGTEGPDHSGPSTDRTKPCAARSRSPCCGMITRIARITTASKIWFSLWQGPGGWRGSKSPPARCSPRCCGCLRTVIWTRADGPTKFGMREKCWKSTTCM